MAGKRGVIVHNHMVLLNCPISGPNTPANATKQSNYYRCTKCGELHFWSK